MARAPSSRGAAAGARPPAAPAAFAPVRINAPAATPAQASVSVAPRDGGAAGALSLAEPLFEAGASYEPMPQSFAELLALCDTKREAVMRSHLHRHVHLVYYEPGRIEFRPAEGAPQHLANRLGELLREWTGRRWAVVISGAEGAPTLKQEEERQSREERNAIAVHPLVRAVFEIFPGAKMTAIRERLRAAETDGEALPFAGEPSEDASGGGEGA
jgi:DNA polymerase-3 subunit gamma/tau